MNDLSELRSWTLAECDALAATISAPPSAGRLLEGAVAGMGGIVTETLNVPILLAATLRSIFRIGHCYGFPLDSEIDRLLRPGHPRALDGRRPGSPPGDSEQLRDLDADPAAPPTAKSHPPGRPGADPARGPGDRCRAPAGRRHLDP